MDENHPVAGSLFHERTQVAGIGGYFVGAFIGQFVVAWALAFLMRKAGAVDHVIEIACGVTLAGYICLNLYNGDTLVLALIARVPVMALVYWLQSRKSLGTRIA